MAKFVCITQSDGMTVFTGPSGTQYTSTYGEPFVVSLLQDIEYFKKNKRFEDYGLFKKPKLPPKNQNTLDLELAHLGLSAKSMKTLTELYVTMDVLRNQVLGGSDLTADISKKDASKVVKFVMPDTDNLDNTDEVEE